MSVKTESVCRVISMRLVEMLRRIIGSVTRKNRFTPLAPSTSAASVISGGTSDSAAE